jgi:hypothetical protein
MMNRIQKLALAVGLAAAAHFNIATAAVPLSFAPGLEACVRNCGQITQVGNSLVITLLDKTGKPFKVASVDVDPKATKAVVAGSNDNLPAQPIFNATAASGDVTSKTVTTTMQTPTQTIVFVVTYFYSNGVLIDCKISEHRFDKQKEK